MLGGIGLDVAALDEERAGVRVIAVGSGQGFLPPTPQTPSHGAAPWRPKQQHEGRTWYDASDPRSKLAPGAEAQAAARVAPAHFYRLDDPDASDTQHWYAFDGITLATRVDCSTVQKRIGTDQVRPRGSRGTA